MHDILRNQIDLCLNEKNEEFSKEHENLIGLINETYIKNDEDISDLECVIKNLNHQLDEINQELIHEKYERVLLDLQIKGNEYSNHVSDQSIVFYLKNKIASCISLAKRADSSVSILHIGIDNFKLLNEMLGYDACNRILLKIEEKLKSCCRDGDIFSHYSKDEFILVLSLKQELGSAELALDEPRGLVVQQVVGIVKRIQDTVSQLVNIEEDKNFKITCSIGISTYPYDGDDIDELLRHSGAALDFAKISGGSGYRFYSQDESKKKYEHILLCYQLQQAIAGSELELHYQPQVDLITGGIVGVEALVRWNHPERGLLFPNDFIFLAEESDLIISLDKWVINEACSKLRDWNDKGLGWLRMSVNVSAKQFDSSCFLETISEAIDKTKILPNCLDIEITEQSIINNIEQSTTIFEKIKNLGIQLSIDDFGTGYSSLSYLKRFPIDILKIDQAFVRDIGSNKEGEIICKTIISMGHNLGFRVIAEGVENEQQCCFLNKNLCDEIQGYIFSKGMPSNKIEELISSEKKLPPHFLRFYESPKTLLLVDDDQYNITAMTRIFRRENYRILCANNGNDGLVMVSENHVDVVVSDFRMPIMDGAEFLTKIKEKNPEVIRILLTAQTDVRALLGAINEGAVFQVITKPYSDSQLKLHVAEAFKQKELADHKRRQ